MEAIASAVAFGALRSAGRAGANLAPNFHDEPNWKRPTGAPGQLTFHAELWKSGARRVVLLTESGLT